MRSVSGLIVILLSCFISAFAVSACTSYSNDNGDGGDGQDDGQIQDAGDAGGDDLGGDSRKDAGGDDIGGDDQKDSGGDPGNPVDCSCKDSRDRVENDGICARDNYTCNALNLCDDGYECMWDSKCVCMDLDVCGIDCSSGCRCPNPKACDDRTGTCRMPLACLEDEMCSDGRVCREGDQLELPIMYYICVPPSGAGTGQRCDRSRDCMSGICHTNVCLQACESNADCPDGQLCTEANHGKLGCVLQTNCGADCDGPDEFCEYECRNDNCRTHADCPGDCTLQIDRPVIGRCTERALCEDHEFVIDMGMGAYCLIHQACWTDADCEAPYSCLSGEDLMMPADGAAFCGRLVRSEQCHGDCQNGTVCDVRTGTCIQPQYCLEDEMCPQGEVCIEGMPVVDAYFCVPPSGGDLEEPCREPSDCKSGICETSICLQVCRANSDCPGAQLCSEVNHGKLGCVLLTECPPTCYGPDEFCDGFSCQTVNCRTSADCVDDCAIDISRPVIGECVLTSNCSDNEFFSRPAAFCLIHQTCLTDADCESPYRCIMDWELVMMISGAGFCGRSI